MGMVPSRGTKNVVFIVSVIFLSTVLFSLFFSGHCKQLFYVHRISFNTHSRHKKSEVSLLSYMHPSNGVTDIPGSISGGPDR